MGRGPPRGKPCGKRALSHGSNAGRTTRGGRRNRGISPVSRPIPLTGHAEAGETPDGRTDRRRAQRRPAPRGARRDPTAVGGGVRGDPATRAPAPAPAPRAAPEPPAARPESLDPPGEPRAGAHGPAAERGPGVRVAGDLAHGDGADDRSVLAPTSDPGRDPGMPLGPARRVRVQQDRETSTARGDACARSNGPSAPAPGGGIAGGCALKSGRAAAAAPRSPSYSAVAIPAAACAPRRNVAPTAAPPSIGMSGQRAELSPRDGPHRKVARGAVGGPS
jgi:hypothetical protein